MTPSRLRSGGLRPALRAVYLGRPAFLPRLRGPLQRADHAAARVGAETLKVVMTGSAEDGPEWQKQIGDKKHRRDLALRRALPAHDGCRCRATASLNFALPPESRLRQIARDSSIAKDLVTAALRDHSLAKKGGEK